MALSLCNNQINAHGMETLKHGPTAFPIACYQDDLVKMEVPWHWHEELEAIYVAEGTANFSLKDSAKIFQIHACDGCFINSGILHSAKNSSQEVCTLHSIVFHPRLVGGNIDSIFWQKYLAPLVQNKHLPYLTLSQHNQWQNELLGTIHDTWCRLRHEKPGYEFEIRNALSTFLYQLYLHCPISAASINPKELRQSERIKQMLQFIHTYYMEEINTQKIAGSIALSQSECLRCFHNTIGTTPIQYLMEYRIQKATELLEQTDDKISEIAFSCGFREMSYFTKCFKKFKGHTPSEHRKVCALC